MLLSGEVESGPLFPLFRFRQCKITKAEEIEPYGGMQPSKAEDFCLFTQNGGGCFSVLFWSGFGFASVLDFFMLRLCILLQQIFVNERRLYLVSLLPALKVQQT